jgi:hypothetical protein
MFSPVMDKPVHNLTREDLQRSFGMRVIHFKGNEYIIVMRTIDSETQKERIVYRPMGFQHRAAVEPPWDRPLDEFLDLVLWPDGVQRTRFVKPEGE